MAMCPNCQAFHVKYPVVVDEDNQRVHVLGDNGEMRTEMEEICCAFDGVEEFQGTNWNCATMNFLRILAEDNRIWHNDSNLGVVPIPDDAIEHGAVQSGMLVMSWYKRRGEVNGAMVFNGCRRPLPLTLETALFILRHPTNQERLNNSKPEAL